MSEDFKQVGVELVAEYARGAQAALTDFEKEQQKLIKSILDSQAATEKDAEAAQKGVRARKEAAQKLRELNQILDTSTDDIKKMTLAQAQANEGITRYSKSLLEAGYNLQQVASSLGVTEEQLKAMVRAEHQQSEAAKQTIASLQGIDRSSKNVGKSLLKNIKTLALWTVGAASVYYMIRRIRAAFKESVKELYGNTQGYKDLTAATKNAKNALTAMSMESIGGEKTFGMLAETIRHLTSGFEDFLWVMTALTEANLLSPGGLGAALGTGKLSEQLRVGVEAANDWRNRVNEITAATEDAAEAQEDLAKKLEEAQLDTLADLLGIYEDNVRELEDIQTDFNRDRLDAAREYARDRVDIDKELMRDLQDINRDLARQMAEIEDDYQDDTDDERRKYQDKRESLARKLRNKLIDIEEKYRDQLASIREQYQMNAREAINKRDALALANARRQRVMEEREAARDRDRARDKAIRDYEARLADLEDALHRETEQERSNAEERREQARRDAEWAREDARIAAQRKRDDLQTAFEREREDRQIALRRQREDQQTALRRQLEDLRSHYQHVEMQLRDELLPDVENTYRSHLERMLSMHNQHWAQMVPFNSSSTVSQPNVPRPTYNDVGVSGTIDLNARIEQSMSGLDGRLSAAMDQALNDVLGGGVQIQ